MGQILVRRTDLKTCFLETKFLYGQSSRQKQVRNTPVHNHACWQLEGMVKGYCSIKTASVSTDIESGQLLVIPPGFNHRFAYDNSESCFISLKFNLNIPAGYRAGSWQPQIISGPETVLCYEILMRALDKCSDENETVALISSIEHLTASIIEKAYFFSKKDMNDPIISRLKWLINKQPQHQPKVKELSRLLNCNRKYVAAHIRNETGMTIKEFIDSERAEIAAQTLAHSQNTIGEVACMLGFPDQYTFSRFFKKLKNVSPREFRKDLNLVKKTAANHGVSHKLVR